VVCTIAILNFRHRDIDTHDMPKIIRVIFLKWLPWCLRMERPGTKHLQLKEMLLKNKMKKMEKADRCPMKLVPTVLDHGEEYIAGAIANLNHPLQRGQLHQMDSLSDTLEDSASSLQSSYNSSYKGLQGSSEMFGSGCKTVVGSTEMVGSGCRGVRGSTEMVGSECREVRSSTDMVGSGYRGVRGSTEMVGSGCILHRRVGREERALQEILKEMRLLSKNLQENQEAKNFNSEWKYAAMVLDRVCLVVFTSTTLLISFAVLIAAPRIIVV